MKKNIFLMLIIFAAMFPVKLFAIQNMPEPKNVLLINSYHPGYKWSDSIITGIQNEFELNNSIILNIEYLDSRNQSDDKYRNLIKELIKHKMHKMKFDLIIALDEEALNFIAENEKTIFRELPVVFCSINASNFNQIKNKKNITGVYENAAIDENLKLIRLLHPKSKHVKIITDISEAGSATINEINTAINASKLNFSYEIIDYIPKEVLLRKIKQVEPDTVLLYTFFTPDSTGQTFKYNESLELLTSFNDVPVYGTWDYNIGLGIIGGYLVSGVNQGKTIAKMSLNILNGTSPNEIPVIQNCEKKYIFDYNQLVKFQVDFKALPEGSEVIGRPETFYSQNKKLVLNVVIYIAILLLIIFILAVNMSARISAEKSLIKTKNFLHDVIESMPSMLITIDGNFTITSCNKKVSDFSGLNQGLIKDGNLFRVFPDFSILEPVIKIVINENRDIFNRSIDILNKGSVHSTLVSVYHLSDSTSNEVVLRIDDVTEKVQRQQEMSKLRNLLADITNSMSSMIAAVDENMNIIQWNSAAEKQSGRTAEECIGLKLFDVYPPIMKYEKFILQSINTKVDQEFIKVPVFIKNETKYIDILIFPLTGMNSIGAVIRIDDVTERAKIEEVLIQSEKMMSVGGLAAGMAHEINNPLAGIMQGAQMLQLSIDPAIPKNQIIAEECNLSLTVLQEYFQKRNIFRMIETIVTSVQRAADIVTNMLSFSRKASSSMELIDLAELFDRTIELAKNDYDLKKKYDFKKIDIHKNYAQPLQLIKCNSSEIQQVFFNILKNGAQAMMDRHNASNIERKHFFNINIIQKQYMLTIEIEDNGPGMPEEVRRRVFEPFFTTKSGTKGIGLGLSVSYFIITENHKGTMNVESVPEFGSKFIINLPLNGDEDEF